MVGDYRIDSLIGRGGMGAVYQATQPVIDKRVAIKVLHRAASKHGGALERFIREARAVNKIGHPNIVDVFGFGTTEDDRPYLVMELLVGETLATRMARDAIPFATMCDVLVEISHALEAAHEAGFIHRDLKPDNVFLAARKDKTIVKLLDFGVTKLIGLDGGAQGEETKPGVVIGTPRYVSPEQVRGQRVDGRADIYALGVVAFELFAGRAPFVAADSYELFEKHAKLRPPALSAFQPGLPAELDALVARMLDKLPANRPTLAELRAVLQAVRGLNVVARASSVDAQPTDVLGAPVQATDVATDQPTTPASRVRRHRARWIGIAAIVPIAGAIVALALSRGDEPRPIITLPVLPDPPRSLPQVTPDPEPVVDVVATPKPPRPKRVPHSIHTTAKAKPAPSTATPPAAPAPPSGDDDAVRSPFGRAP